MTLTKEQINDKIKEMFSHPCYVDIIILRRKNTDYVFGEVEAIIIDDDTIELHYVDDDSIAQMDYETFIYNYGDYEIM